MRDSEFAKIGQRPLHAIARDVARHWRDKNGVSKVWFGAVPYLRAMATLETMDDAYGADDAHTIVIYFLANAQTWRGEHARRIKRELKGMLR